MMKITYSFRKVRRRYSPGTPGSDGKQLAKISILLFKLQTRKSTIQSSIIITFDRAFDISTCARIKVEFFTSRVREVREVRNTIGAIDSDTSRNTLSNVSYVLFYFGEVWTVKPIVSNNVLLVSVNCCNMLDYEDDYFLEEDKM
jgi:hypothetical protein